MEDILVLSKIFIILLCAFLPQKRALSLHVNLHSDRNQADQMLSHWFGTWHFWNDNLEGHLHCSLPEHCMAWNISFHAFLCTGLEGRWSGSFFSLFLYFSSNVEKSACLYDLFSMYLCSYSQESLGRVRNMQLQLQVNSSPGYKL